MYAFLVKPERLLISSSDPKGHVFRKYSAFFLDWCSRYGQLYLHTDMPETTSSPEMLLSVQNFTKEMGYAGPWERWSGQQDEINETFRKTKFASGFGVVRAITGTDLRVDKATGYSRLARKGLKIIHVDTQVTDMEKRQIEGMGGTVILFPPLPSPESHEIRWLPDPRNPTGYTIVQKSDRAAFGPFDLTEFEKSITGPTLRQNHLATHGQTIIDRHLSVFDVHDLMASLVPKILAALEGGKGRVPKPISKGTGSTVSALDYWEQNIAKIKAAEDPPQS